jgi:predicted amidohydrolase
MRPPKNGGACLKERAVRETKLMIVLVQQRSGPDVEENIERGVRSFAKAARPGARLIAFAKLAFSRFYPHVPAARRLWEIRPHGR